MRPRALTRALLAALVTAGFALTAGAEERPAGDALARAEVAYAAGRYPQALGEAREAAATAPTSARAVLTHAVMAEFMGEFDEAQGAYTRARALAPDSADVLYRGALFAVRLGEHGRALALLDRIVELVPSHVRWLFQYAPGRLQPTLLRDNPGLEQIVQTRIDILMETGNLEGARALARAYGIVETGRPYCAEATGAREGRSNEETFRAFRLATLAEPHAAECIWWYGQWLTDEGYVRLGRLMVLEGTRVANGATYKASGARYLRVRLGGGREVPKRAEQLFLIARQRYLRDRDPAGAVRLLEEVRQLAPTFVRPYDYRAQIAWDEGDRTGALAWLRRGLEVDPDSWRTHRNLGTMLAALERWAEAEHHLRRTLELFEDDAGGRLALARTLYAQQKYGEYESETRAALKLATAWQEPAPDVRAFLKKFERWGPGVALPSAPELRLFIGWNYD